MLVSFFIVDAHRNEILLRYFGTPNDGSTQVNGQIVYARFFYDRPGRDDFHSKSCLYKSRLLLPVNVCVFIIVPTFDDHILPRASGATGLGALGLLGWRRKRKAAV